MDRWEFFKVLKEQLYGEVPPQVIEENVRYYQGYIEEEIRKGRTEEEVLAELGSPRLIAKTILESDEAQEEAEYGSTYEERRFGDSGDYERYQETYEEPKRDGFDRQQDPLRGNVHRFHVAGWMVLAAVLFVLFLILQILALIPWYVWLVFIGWLVWRAARR